VGSGGFLATWGVDYRFHLVDGERLVLFTMNDAVTVGADRHQIGLRIHGFFLPLAF